MGKILKPQKKKSPFRGVDQFMPARETEAFDEGMFHYSNDVFLGIAIKAANVNRNQKLDKFINLYFVDRGFTNGFFREIGSEVYKILIRHLRRGENDCIHHRTYMYDLIRVSKFLGLTIRNENIIYLRFEAPMMVGITNRNQITNQFVMVLQKAMIVHSYITEHSEYEDYAFKAAFPISKHFNLKKGKYMSDKDDHDDEFDLSDYGIVIETHTDIHPCIYDALSNGGMMIQPQITNEEEDSTSKRAGTTSYFYEVMDLHDILSLIDESSLKEIVPGRNRQIYIVFLAPKIIGVQIDATAENDSEYTIETIDGCLTPVGPVEMVKEETQHFTVVFAPVKTGDDGRDEKFVWTRTFVGYPHVFQLYDSLREGDVIYGSEVNARNLHPVAPEKRRK